MPRNVRVDHFIDQTAEYKRYERVYLDAAKNVNARARKLLDLAKPFQSAISKDFPRKMYIGSRNGTGVLVSYHEDGKHTVEVVDVVIGKSKKGNNHAT